MANPNGNPQNLKPPWSSTNQPKNRGRKPSSVKKYIKDNNLNYNDISIMTKHILPLTNTQLIDLVKNEKAPFMLRLFASAILKDFKKGYIDNIMKIIDRAVGKPREKIELSEDLDNPVLTREERIFRIKELQEKLLLDE